MHACVQRHMLRHTHSQIHSLSVPLSLTHTKLEHTYAHTCTHMYKCACTLRRQHTHIYAYASGLSPSLPLSHTQTHTQTQIQAQTQVQTQTHTHTNIHTHTHIQQTQHRHRLRHRHRPTSWPSPKKHAATTIPATIKPIAHPGSPVSLFGCVSRSLAMKPSVRARYERGWVCVREGEKERERKCEREFGSVCECGHIRKGDLFGVRN